MLNTEKKIFNAISEIFNYYDGTRNEIKISICDYILNGNLFVRFGNVPKSLTYEKELKYNIENFDWDVIYPPLPNTCQLYLQAFNTIKYLIQGYQLSLNEKYMDLASDMIESWLKYEPNSKNKFTWYDHSVSDRAIVMIYFILLSKKTNIRKNDELINRIENSLIKHANFLFDDNNYQQNNHGILCDRSLYLISIFLNSPSAIKYREKSIARLKKALKRNFSDQMVNVESSISYHQLNLILFITLESLLNRFGDSCGFDQPLIEKAVDFLIYSSKPNCDYPSIGNSIKIGLKSLKKSSIFPYIKHFLGDYAPLIWFLTEGKSGNPPEELFKAYKTEGYAFFRNFWDNTQENPFYVSFVAGSSSGPSSSRGHKHADDLSFTLFAEGKDILVDSGVYTYEDGDMKDYFVSALAHNTIVVDDQSYSFRHGDEKDTSILDYGEEEYYCYVIGKNDMYSGVNLTRSLYYLKSGDLVIVDYIQSPEIHKYSQYYHLGPKIFDDIEVKSIENGIIAIAQGEDIVANLYQIGQCDFSYIKGDRNKAGPGIISEYYEHLEETISLKFSLESDNARFITFITVNNENKKQYHVHENNSKNGSTELIISGYNKEIKIPLKEYRRKMSPYLRVQQNDEKSYTFTITQAEKDETFAWYILKNGEKIDEIWYNPNPTLNYTFQEPGKYQIKYYIKNGEKTKTHTLERIINIKKEKIKPPKKINIQKKDETHYTFTITPTEKNETFAWYILKNGEKIDEIWYNPNPTLNYTFQEPGEYGIKYFIKKGEKIEMHTMERVITINDENISN